MLLDDSMTLPVGGDGIAVPTGTAPTVTFPVYDTGAAGSSDRCNIWWVLHMIKAVVGATGGTLSLQTSADTTPANFKTIATAVVDSAALAAGKLPAKIQEPKEGVKQYIRFILTLTGSVTTAGTAEIVATPSVELGL